MSAELFCFMYLLYFVCVCVCVCGGGGGGDDGANSLRKMIIFRNKLVFFKIGKVYQTVAQNLVIFFYIIDH